MLTPGALLQDRYQIIRSVGQGGVGTVYEATDGRLGHTVAIKQILHSDSSLRAAFEREARLLARLHHPALPRVTDHFVEGSAHFLVMEFVPGADLAALRRRQKEPLAVDDVLRWADRLLDALIYLHSQQPPVVHRDIKPHNLKLNERGEVILLDFGLAKGAPGQSPGERSVAGYTLHYAPPEQLRGEQTDPRSDLYALAATLYDLLSATKPPDALQRLTTLATGQPDPLRPLHRLNPAVPADLAALIHQALALDPRARFADATAMRLSLHAAGAETTELLPSPTQPARACHQGNRAPATSAHNLPAQLTSFVGREAEVAAVQQLLQSPNVRLVTLTGPGGIGKTRLALTVANCELRIATDQSQFPAGVYFVSLALVREPHLVLPTIAQTLGLREAANTTVLQSLQTHLQDKKLLLVLDNFEQVVAAAPSVGDLLAAAPHLKVLITSRATLQIRGEQEFPVPALGLPNRKRQPPLEDLAQFAAIQLFTQRAQLVKPGFQLNETNAAAIVEICRRLDGLPLAIELAAASVKVLAPQAILTRLTERFELLHSGARDAPDRQRTLQASIGWSYDLLTEDEKAIFRRLAVFRGSFDLEAAEAIWANTGRSSADVLERIVSLIDKSLLKPFEGSEDEPRFTMLETLREFGLRRLAEEGEAEAVQQAHAEYYYQLTVAAERQIWGANIAASVRRLDVENDNLRTALNYYLAHAEGAARSLTLAGLLWRFWEIRGYIVEGRAWLDRALQRRAEVPPSGRWLALHAAGNLASDQGEYAVARQHYLESLHLLQTLLESLTEPAAILQTQYAIGNTLLNLGNTAISQSEFAQAITFTEEALALHRQLDGKINSKIGIGLTLTNLAAIKLYQGQYAQAETFSQEALALYRTLGDERGIGWSLSTLGTIARERGDYARAAQLYQECRLLLEKLSNQADMALLYLNLGELARQVGNYAEAEAHFQAGLTVAQTLGSKKESANLLNRLSMVACHWERYGQATTLSSQSIALYRELGNRLGLSESLHQRGRLAFVQGDDRAAAADFRESLQLKAELGAQKGIVYSFKAFAALAAATGGLAERAARLLGAAETLRNAIGLAVPPAERAEDESLLTTVRTTLGDEGFARAWAAGQALTLEQAIVYAQEEK